MLLHNSEKFCSMLIIRLIYHYVYGFSRFDVEEMAKPTMKSIDLGNICLLRNGRIIRCGHAVINVVVRLLKSPTNLAKHNLTGAPNWALH